MSNPTPPNTTSTSPKIGIIVCSQRTPRAGLQITQFVLSALQATHPTANLHLIDLRSWSLPLFDEPGVPSQIHSAANYAHPHTRAWSAHVASFAAFVFVTPQYNWGYPASIKNAIDYLFHEWEGKPAMVVSYGGHGGGKAGAQLRQVLMGVRMRVVERAVELEFPGREFMVRAATGNELDLESGKVWEKERGEMEMAFRELVRLLET